jgi:hypothetical protein
MRMGLVQDRDWTRWCWHALQIESGEDNDRVVYDLFEEPYGTQLSDNQPDVAKFDIYLLEAFTRILQYDNGIEFFVRCGIVRRLNEILKNTNDAYFNQNFTERVNYLYCFE